MVTLFFLFYPSLNAKLSTGWNSTQYRFLPEGVRYILDKLAGKILALMAPIDTFLDSTGPYWTGMALYE